MKFIACALLSATLAVLIAPVSRVDETPSAPWPKPVLLASSLGRTYAAADVAWLKTVQVMGSSVLEKQGWPHLEGWIDLTTRLDPAFDLPYFFGATLLVTDARRAKEVEVILARGEAALPDEFSLPMLRGFLAQFGTLDSLGAADHYRRAADKPGAPAYLGSFAKRLAQQESDCSSVLRDLRAISDSSSSEQATALHQQRGKIFEHCVANQLERAATKFRLDNGRDATVEELVERGIIQRPPAPEGRCWKLVSGTASLQPCQWRMTK